MALLEPRPAGRKLEHLTGLRFVLILWVVLFHLSGLQPGPASVASKSPLDAVATAAFEVSPKDGPPTVRYAVAGFIVMSGFVTQWSQGARRRRNRAGSHPAKVKGKADERSPLQP